MSAFGGDALQRKAMSHKSSFIILDYTQNSFLSFFFKEKSSKLVTFLAPFPIFITKKNNNEQRSYKNYKRV